MKRREFISICGVAGVGLLVGLAPTQRAHSLVTGRPLAGYERKPVWMHGSAKTGCARLPALEYPDCGIDLPALV
jgi:hypothetical protein